MERIIVDVKLVPIMLMDHELAVAKEVFNEPGQNVLGIDDSHLPTLVVSMRDEYGVLECEVRDGALCDAVEFRRSLEAHKNGRATKIAEWNYQKKLAAEIIDHLNGEPDPTGRMGWLPELVYKRFLDHFRLHFPELEKLVTNPGCFDKDALIAELETIPFSWQHNP